MLSLFCVCGILIVFEKFAESRPGYKSLFEQRKCIFFIFLVFVFDVVISASTTAVAAAAASSYAAKVV